MEFLSICKEFRAPINITTNGTLLSEEICKELISNDYIEIFGFSFDGVKRETVEWIRRDIDYQKVIDNMCLMSALKSKYKREYPALFIRCSVMKRNIEELPDLIRYARKWGINKVGVNYLNVANEMDKNESLFFHPGLTERVFEEVSKIAKAEKIQVYLPGLPTAQFGVKSCNFPWRFIKIDPDGSVRFCYKAWNNPVGNIFETNNFFDLWNNDQYQLVRKTVNSDKPYFKYCSVCSARKGYGAESSHVQYMQEELYQFDREYEKLQSIKTPGRITSYPKDERGRSCSE